MARISGSASCACRNSSPVMIGRLILLRTSAIAEASELIDRFGIHAISEAAARADRSRELGNVIHFCRWRQIERIIPILASDRAEGTIH